MPKGKAHKVIGTAVGVAVATGYSYCVERDSANAWQYALGGGLGGYTMARLADMLEPVEILGPNHRGVFHGVALNGGMTAVTYKPSKEFLKYLIDKARAFDRNDENFKAMLCRIVAGFFIGALGGHVSHLVADSTTPMGLPLLY